MFSLKTRKISPELLDSASAEDRRQSLRDLQWINRVSGPARIARKILKGYLSASPAASLLDVGAGAGDMGARLRAEFPNLQVVSLDISYENLELGTGLRVNGDAFCLPFGDKSFDVVFCNHFLHHFPPQELIGLLKEFQRVARRFIVAIDLERTPLLILAFYLGWPLFRWNRVTMHDAPVSIAAGFQHRELVELLQQAGFKKAKVTRHLPWLRLSVVIEV